MSSPVHGLGYEDKRGRVAHNEEPKEAVAFPATPTIADHAVSALNAWVGDYLADTGNGLAVELGWVRDNAPIAPSALIAPASGRVAVVVHGLGCNEACFRFPKEPETDFGTLLASDHGFLPLYLRYNTGRRVSQNGADLARLLDATWGHFGSEVHELVLIGHSMGGLLLRSACHLGADRPWARAVRHAFYLGSPHLGAPLEKFANITTHVLGKIPTTATRVIRDVINTRSSGVKDLRYGNLTDADWLNLDPDALLHNKRVAVPWLEGTRHHRVVGHALAHMPIVGDGMVLPNSASAAAQGEHPSAPGDVDVTVMRGLDHLSLARDKRVYDFMVERL